MLFIPVMVCLFVFTVMPASVAIFMARKLIYLWWQSWFSEAKCQSVIRFFLISKSNSSLLNKNVLISFFKKKKFWPKLFNV